MKSANEKSLKKIRPSVHLHRTVLVVTAQYANVTVRLVHNFLSSLFFSLDTAQKQNSLKPSGKLHLDSEKETRENPKAIRGCMCAYMFE